MEMTELEKDCLKVLLLIKKIKDSSPEWSTEDVNGTRLTGTPLSGTYREIFEQNSDSLSMDFSRFSNAIDYLSRNLYITNSRQPHPMSTNYFRISEDLGEKYLVKLKKKNEEDDLRIRTESERLRNQDESVRVSMSESKKANRISLKANIISLAAFIVAVIAVVVSEFKEEKSANVDLSNYVTKDVLKNYVTNDKLKTYSDSTIIDLIDRLHKDNTSINQFPLKK